jgi:endonuclease YncB( thermonuclease family)
MGGMIQQKRCAAIVAVVWLMASLPLATLGQRATSTLIGKTVGVTDGDTISVLDAEKRQHKVRLEGIDAPESAQPFGTQAKKALSEKVFGKEITVKETGKDKYGRTLGHVYVSKQHVNRELIEEGFAWHYKEYNRDPNFAAAENEARAAKRGLWRDGVPTPPWDYRHAPKMAANAKPKVTRTSASDQTTPTVYITDTGKKYHRDRYNSLSRSKHAVSLADAHSRGLGPCKICKPPE